jgi:hypothetical protein
MIWANQVAGWFQPVRNAAAEKSRNGTDTSVDGINRHRHHRLTCVLDDETEEHSRSRPQHCMFCESWHEGTGYFSLRTPLKGFPSDVFTSMNRPVPVSRFTQLPEGDWV